jgi:ribonuclease HI
MSTSAPHFLLFSESLLDQRPTRPSSPERREVGHWRFVLESVDGSTRLEADDTEPEVDEHRLELLAVVRGLEALNEPSRVTLVTRSRYVTRGFRYRLEQWRENDWCWERFGEMTPIRNRDLWRRIDCAMRYHHVECRVWRFDAPHARHPQSSGYAAVSKKKPYATTPHRVTLSQRTEKPTAWITRVVNRCLDLLPRIAKPFGIGFGAGYLI